MPFDPPFITRFEEFDQERQRIRTLEEWLDFAQKWFDTSTWPKKRPEQYAADQARKRGPLTLGGRTWSFTSDGYDLTPEARYEWSATWHTVGDPLRFPHPVGVPREASAGWSQECGYCEIATNELGDEVCPGCGRKLCYVCYSD